MYKRDNSREHTAPLGHLSPRFNEALLSQFETALNSEIVLHRALLHDESRSFTLEFKDGLKTRLFSLEYLKTHVFSKYVVLNKDNASERRQNAIDKWLLMESRNTKSNVRLYALPATICGMETEDIFSRAASIISDVLGDTPPHSVLYGTFSGGASTSQKRGPGAVAAKFGDKVDVTEAAWSVFKETLESCETWSSVGWQGVPNPRLVPGSVLFTVPKNSVIDRVAAKEPDLNMFMQKGIGNFIRARLRINGVDLNDQSTNQRLAWEGSRENLLATVDLSSASDSISTSLVLRLLPARWFELLDRVRSRSIDIDGKQHELGMFSSMGNGFTFELESLIFWALVRSVSYLKKIRGRINVYGDDIIVPVKMYPMLERVFSYFGFILNRNKSFGRGKFRESCGKHYVNGCDVTPFFVRSPLLHQSDLILMLNNLTGWLTRNTGHLATATDPDSLSFAEFPYLNQYWNEASTKIENRFKGGSVDWIGTANVLVSSDKPKSLLRQATKECSLPQDGAYLHWLRLRCPTQLWPNGGTFIGPWKQVYEGTSIWNVEGLRIKGLQLREPLVTSKEVVTLEAQWVVRPYRDVLFGVDPRK